MGHAMMEKEGTKYLEYLPDSAKLASERDIIDLVGYAGRMIPTGLLFQMREDAEDWLCRERFSLAGLPFFLYGGFSFSGKNRL